MAERIVVDWNQSQYNEFCRDPNGELGREMMHVIGAGLVERAQARALKRTGRMADEITFEVDADELGVYCDMISPVTDPQTGTAYARFHERAKPRDRRPHRSLVPALDELPAITEA